MSTILLTLLPHSQAYLKYLTKIFLLFQDKRTQILSHWYTNLKKVDHPWVLKVATDHFIGTLFVGFGKVKKEIKHSKNEM